MKAIVWLVSFFFILLPEIRAEIRAEAMVGQGNNAVLNLDKIASRSVNLAAHTHLYLDRTSSLGIFDAIRQPSLFSPNQSAYPGFGFTRSTLWGKFTWTGSGNRDAWNLVFDYTMLDQIDIYVINGAGQIVNRISGGASVPFYEKPVENRKHVFRLQSPGADTETVYFRVKTEDTLEVPLLLVDNDTYNRNESHNSLLLGIYYGIILVMFIYNFFIFLTLRDIAYLNYVVYLLSYGIVMLSMDGFLNQFVFPSSNEMSKNVRMVCANIAIIFALRFANNFFRFKRNFPWFEKILFGVYALAGLNTVLVFFDFMSGAVVVFFLLFVSVLVFVIFSVRLFREYPPVRLYFYGWIAFIVCTFIWVLKLWNIYIPGITPYAMQVGSATEVTLLSFALGGRISMIRIEKDKVKKAVIKHRQRAVKEKSQFEALKTRARGIEKDLSLARDIQMSMIPLKSPVDFIKSIYLPMEKVGGDFFNIIPLRNGRLGILISDVSGHGVPAALITVMVRSLIVTGLNQLENEKEASWLEDPDRFMIHLNNTLYGHLHGNFISVFFGIYNPVDRSFIYQSASHPPPIILKHRGGKSPVELSFLGLSPQLPPVGVKIFGTADLKSGQKRVILEEGSRLILYSDGLMDNLHYDYEYMNLGLESFRNSILYDIFSSSGEASLVEFMALISSELLLYRDIASLEDDVCVVTMDIKDQNKDLFEGVNYERIR